MKDDSKCKAVYQEICLHRRINFVIWYQTQITDVWKKINIRKWVVHEIFWVSLLLKVSDIRSVSPVSLYSSILLPAVSLQVPSFVLHSLLTFSCLMPPFPDSSHFLWSIALTLWRPVATWMAFRTRYVATHYILLWRSADRQIVRSIAPQCFALQTETWPHCFPYPLHRKR
jgi:hypothetical protein